MAKQPTRKPHALHDAAAMLRKTAKILDSLAAVITADVASPASINYHLNQAEHNINAVLARMAAFR